MSSHHQIDAFDGRNDPDALVPVRAGELFEWAWLAGELADWGELADTSRLEFIKYRSRHSRTKVADFAAHLGERIAELLDTDRYLDGEGVNRR